MKRFSRVILSIITLAYVVGCDKIEETDIPVSATVTIEKTGSDSVDGFNVRFTPSEDAASYDYAITETATIEDFVAGNVPETVHVTGNELSDVVFSDLNTNTIYTLYARAYDENGEAGGVAQYRVMTGDGLYKVELQYLTDMAVGINIYFTNDYYDSEYYLGTPDDREAFLSGNVEVSNVGESPTDKVTVNYLDLKPSTEYVMYVNGYDRSGTKVFRELPFSTKAEGDCPKVELETISTNVYKSSYCLKANANTGKIIAAIGSLGDFDSNISITNFGDVLGMFTGWAETGWNNTLYSVTGELRLDMTTPELALDNELEIYAISCDKDMNPAGVQRFVVKTPSFNPEAKGGSVSIAISDINEKGATYTYSPDEDCFAFMYDTIDADWYDDLKENSSEWYEFYLSDLLFKQKFYFAYAPELINGKCIFTEKTGQEGVRYYAAACPMNENGPVEGGWLPVVLEEYTTTSKTE